MTPIPYFQPVVPGLDILVGESEGRFPRSHCFVIRGDTDVLVDAGCGLGRLAEVIESWQPEMVLISHSHPDHCAGAWMLTEGFRSQQPDLVDRWQAQTLILAGGLFIIHAAVQLANYRRAHMKARPAETAEDEAQDPPLPPPQPETGAGKEPWIIQPAKTSGTSADLEHSEEGNKKSE